MTKANKIYERQLLKWIEAQAVTIKHDAARIKRREEEIKLMQQTNRLESALITLGKSSLVQAKIDLKKLYQRVKYNG